MRYYDNTATSGFDYEVQAWYENGRYVDCGHPSFSDCRCYGRLHSGEPVPQRCKQTLGGTAR